MMQYVARELVTTPTISMIRVVTTNVMATALPVLNPVSVENSNNKTMSQCITNTERITQPYLVEDH